jgi:CRP/FNR family transcriptional regulator, anaerobic regulatory protein
MHPFRQFIHNYTTLSNEDWLKIEPFLVRIDVKKDTILLEQGKICRHLYFLESGLLRFFILKNGQDVTKYFTDIPYCFTSIKSFEAQIPATESIETLEDTVLWAMTSDNVKTLFNLPAWSTFTRKLIQEVQTYTDEILEDLQTETAENRYKKMLAENDPLLQRVPLKHIASYLGIAPQSLSRIRKNALLKRNYLA